MASKGKLLAILPSLTAGMCKGFAVGEAAGRAKNPLLDVMTVNKDLSDASTGRKLY